MLVSTKQMLQNAYEGHYAVAAINTQGGTYDIIRAVCMAAMYRSRSTSIMATQWKTASAALISALHRSCMTVRR